MSFDVDAPYYDLFSSRDYAAAATKIVKAFPEARDILEIGAGTGNLTVELEALGFTVTAIEPSIEMCERFKSNTAMIHPGTFQEFYSRRIYDLGIIDNAVLKFIPSKTVKVIMKKLQVYCRETAVGFDLLAKPPRMFERKIQTEITRFQFCVRFRKRAWLWYLYLTPTGVRLSFHRLYFHDMKDFS